MTSATIRCASPGKLHSPRSQTRAVLFKQWAHWQAKRGTTHIAPKPCQRMLHHPKASKRPATALQ